MDTDLRQELWHCLRLWVFEYRYFDPSKSPFPKLAKYGPTPATFHALSHWKLWMQSKPGFEEAELTARYNCQYKNDRKSRERDYERLIILPDDGEDEYRDYQLSKAGDSRPLCVGDVEYSCKLHHINKGLCKRLVPARGQLKFGIYRLNYSDCQNLEDGFAERKRAIESAITNAGRADDKEEWLFVLFPYYRKHPKCSDEASVRLYTLTTPCESGSPSLDTPNWNIWQFPESMHNWMSKVPIYSSPGGT
jgi:hypothetical protein